MRNNRKVLQFLPHITSIKSYTLTTLTQISVTAMFDFIGVKSRAQSDHPMFIYFYNEVYFINLLLSFNLKTRYFDTKTSSFVFDRYSLFPQ